jgi:hypothetical protein
MRVPLVPMTATCSVMAVAAVTSITLAQTRLPSDGLVPFTDTQYGYSIRIPRGWKPHTAPHPPQTVARLGLVTPLQSSLLVSVSRLPRTITHTTDLATVGETFVEPVVNAYFKIFDLKSVADSKADWSNADSMRLWQGTSATHSGIPGAVLLSMHAIRYESNTMINVVYVSGANSSAEAKQVDNTMKSLAFLQR